MLGRGDRRVCRTNVGVVLQGASLRESNGARAAHRARDPAAAPADQRGPARRGAPALGESGPGRAARSARQPPHAVPTARLVVAGRPGRDRPQRAGLGTAGSPLDASDGVRRRGRSRSGPAPAGGQPPPRRSQWRRSRQLQAARRADPDGSPRPAGNRSGCAAGDVSWPDHPAEGPGRAARGMAPGAVAMPGGAAVHRRGR